MAEPADASDLKSEDSNIVRVRLPLPAPNFMIDFMDPENPVWNYDLVYSIPYRCFVRAWKGELPPNSFKVLRIKKPLKYYPMFPVGTTHIFGQLLSEYWSLRRIDKKGKIW
jgi:hypothetical protein